MAGVKRKLVLLAAAGAGVWMLALLDFGARKPALDVQDEPQAAATDEPLPAAARRNSAHVREAEEPEPPAPGPAAASKPAPASLSGLMRAAQGTVAVIGKAARAALGGGHPHASDDDAPEQAGPAQPREMPATAELGAGSGSPEYAHAEQKFSGEARDGAWASAQEQRVRSLLEPQAWSNHLSVLNCQQSTCRIVIETDSETTAPFQQLLAVPGIGEATGIGAGTPYSMRNGQLSVYFTPPADSGAEHASK